MKKIICVTESLGGGGAEHQMVILSGLLYKKGYDVTLVTFADVPDHYSTPEGVKRVKLGLGKGKLLQTLEIFLFFLRVKADCIISYRQCSNARVSLPLLFRNIKLISGERNATLGKPGKFERLLVDYGLYKRSDYIVPNSLTQSRYLKRKRPDWNKKIIPIINYTDLDKFTSSTIPDDINTLKIAIFARYSEQKNPIRFIEMVKELRKSKKTFQIHWYGQQINKDNSLSEEYIKCKNKVEECNVGDILLLKRAVADPSVLMNDYHALCLPSSYEGFSNSISEAICSGKIVLCSNVSDNSVMVQDGINGFLFDPTDKSSMLKAFNRFFDLSKEEMERMGKISRQKAESLFDKESFLDSYIKLIES